MSKHYAAFTITANIYLMATWKSRYPNTKHVQDGKTERRKRKLFLSTSKQYSNFQSDDYNLQDTAGVIEGKKPRKS